MRWRKLTYPPCLPAAQGWSCEFRACLLPGRGGGSDAQARVAPLSSQHSSPQRHWGQQQPLSPSSALRGDTLLPKQPQSSTERPWGHFRWRGGSVTLTAAVATLGCLGLCIDPAVGTPPIKPLSEETNFLCGVLNSRCQTQLDPQPPNSTGIHTGLPQPLNSAGITSSPQVWCSKSTLQPRSPGSGQLQPGRLTLSPPSEGSSAISTPSGYSPWSIPVFLQEFVKRRFIELI